MADIEAQTALELPARELLALVTIIVTDVLNNVSIPIEVKNNNVAVQVCAAVEVIDTQLLGNRLTCTIQR